MLEIRFGFPLPYGLHARPASRLREVVLRHASRVTLRNQVSGRGADARSALSLVSTLTRHEDACVLEIEGSDELEAAEALRRFVEVDLPVCDGPPAGALAGLEPHAEAAPLPRALSAPGIKVLRGLAASPGVGRGPVFVLESLEALSEAEEGEHGTAGEEQAKVDAALAAVGRRLREQRAQAAHETQREILSAHLAILEDTELVRQVADEVARGASATRAVRAAAGRVASLLRESGSAYLEERALDLRDIAAQLARELRGGGDSPALPAGAVCVAASLGPSQLLALEREHLSGLVLGESGTLSHTVILARALGIPCVAGVLGVERLLHDGREAVVDGERGLVVPEPPPAARAFYEREREKLAAFARRVETYRDRAGATADGRRLEVGANVGSLEEVELAFTGGAEGIGLFRTELLYMGREAPPDEEEQVRILSDMARLAGGRPVIVRTLDVGGDKPLPFLHLPDEPNPFLGFRGIRLYAEHEDLLATQVRAVLRASVAGRLSLMLPMVSTVEEVRWFRRLLDRCRADLAARGVPFDPGLPLGVMVEVPSAAFILDQLAGEVAFFSIGSNDLAQYFLAADRDNEAVAHLCSWRQPAFLRLLLQIVDGARRLGRWIGLCGEMGGDPLAAPILAGLGLDEVSVAPPKVAAVKAALAGCRTGLGRELLLAAASKESADEVGELLRSRSLEGGERALVSAAAVRLESTSRSRDEAIRELVDLLHLEGRVDDADLVEEAVWRREDTASTALGLGLALPHAVSPHILADSLSLLRFEKPLTWAPGEEDPVEMAILVAIRADGRNHLKTIAALSRRLMDDELREALLSADGAEKVAALLSGAAE